MIIKRAQSKKTEREREILKHSNIHSLSELVSRTEGELCN